AELRDVLRRSALRTRGPVIELGDVEAVLPPLHERVPLEELSLEAVVRTKVRALLPRLEGYPITDLYEQILSHVERPLLQEVLARTAGNQLKAAGMLGINRNTLRKKLLERAPSAICAAGPPEGLIDSAAPAPTAAKRSGDDDNSAEPGAFPGNMSA